VSTVPTRASWPADDGACLARRDDPHRFDRCALEAQQVIHVAIDQAVAQLARHGVDVQQEHLAPTLDPGELTRRCGHLTEMVTRAWAHGDHAATRPAVECLCAASVAAQSVTLAVHRGQMGKMVPSTLASVTAAALALTLEPHTEVALTLVLAGEALERARAAAAVTVGS